MRDAAERDELESARSPITPSSPRKRKKLSEGDGEAIRRLRRSHEACTRCRLKKIKCDSGHPSCGACTLVGATCQQEDRHRNKFQPRAHQEMIEFQLTQTVLILKKYIPDYDPARASYFASQVGVSVPEPPPNLPTAPPPTLNTMPYSPSSGGSESQSIKSPIDGASGLSPSTPPTPYFRPPGYQFPPIMGPEKSLANYPVRKGSDAQTRHVESDNGNKGLDPRGSNMASPAAIAKSFGVAPRILENPRYKEPEPLKVEGEDLPNQQAAAASLHPHLWQHRPFKRRPLPSPSHPTPELDMVYLPKNRKIANHLVEMYFERLNFHRPIFEKNDYLRRFESLYSTDTVTMDDVGFICSTYLILALATLSELHQPTLTPTWLAELKAEWPRHEDLFSRALAVKPDLRVTISSLQALLLLQWYLYSERHGRSLWRLVGTLVRLAVELGLHHDPMLQKGTFTPEECTLRVNLWHSVMIHDRGTSVLLGRPVAISEEHFNTASPVLVPGVVSRHFVDSAPLNSIAADIIHSLYRPHIQSTDEVIKHSKRILIRMSNWRKTLPHEYTPYFHGTVGWPEDEKQILRNELTTEKGLTFLKYNIQRLLLLRVIFNNDEMRYDVRIKALDDAIKTSHNVIIMHASLTQIPDIGFFVSPLPLHLAAITIIYGQSCGFTTLTYETGYEDVHSALHITPALRWQWERKDAGGGVHPITLELANRVFKRKPPASDRPKSTSVFMCEEDWEDDAGRSAPADAQLGHWPNELFLPGPAWPHHPYVNPRQNDGSGSSKSASPIGQHAIPGSAPGSMSISNGHHSPNAAIAGPSMPGANTSYFKTEEMDLSSIFAQVPPYAYGAINFQPEPELQELFMQEEKDPNATLSHGYKTGINIKMMEQLQHMGYSQNAMRHQPYPSTSSQPGP